MLNPFDISQDEFAQQYRRGKAQILGLDLVADLETPVSAFLKLCGTTPNSFLLESVEDGEIKGRYSMIGMAPDLIFRIKNGKAEVNRQALTNSDDAAYEAIKAKPLDALRQILKESRIDLPKTVPSMAAGVFGYMSYDTVRYMEELPDNNPQVLDTPESLFIRPTLVAVFDAVTNSLKLVTPVYPTPDVPPEQAYEAASRRLKEAQSRLATSFTADVSAKDTKFQPPKSNIKKPDYYAMVDKARDYIEAGDVFQVVLSQRFETPFPLPPFELYRALRRINPSPYLFYMNFGDFQIVGSSPEVLVGVTAGQVNIRPIAGTRLRGASLEEDDLIAGALLADEKERAEHLMLLDLGRNDVGRVCDMGSVQVNTAFGLQKTSHLIHIVSDVTGKLAQGYDNIDALAAGFPAGTVSGAPKVRAMEIIDELENERRGIYSGCVGYFSANGDMDSCIALRTGVIKDAMLYVQAGGGIVYDSTPEFEYNETVNKAKALFAAAQEAINRVAIHRAEDKER